VADLQNRKTSHKEARKVFIDFSYQTHLGKMTLVKLGAELGRLSGPGVLRIHERLREKVEKDKELNRRMQRVREQLSIV